MLAVLEIAVKDAAEREDRNRRVEVGVRGGRGSRRRGRGLCGLWR